MSSMKRTLMVIAACTMAVSLIGANASYAAESVGPPGPFLWKATGSSSVLTLDGEWLLATDPKNIGREQKWLEAPVADAKKTKVPWIIQDAFPGYHGVAWYWREFTPPANPHPQGRYLLRFLAVDYKAEVWMSGAPVGGHEGGETPFVLDVTDTIRPGAKNLLAVRVLNPTHERIDGMVLNETPKQARVIPYTAGSAYNHGGITGSVELLLAPAVRVEDLFVRADPKTGTIRVQANVRNAGKTVARDSLYFSVAPAASGETLQATAVERELPPGDTLVETELKLENPRFWELNDPFLYRITARLGKDERSTRCGFREFRFENGYFRLNSRRLYLRSGHTCNHFPVGLKLPTDPDLARRDLLNAKAMGFNMIRFIWGGAERYQLDLCDEIGLMVYEESFASWAMGPRTYPIHPQLAERFDRSVSELIRRDRNHPSVVIWGLLNESGVLPALDHAIKMLPLVRALDDTRLVFLNSGGSPLKGYSGFSKLNMWHGSTSREPWITYNHHDTPVESPFNFARAPGQVALHPGEKGEYSVARWTAPEGGEYSIAAEFVGLAKALTTTNVYVLHNGKPLWDSGINIDGKPNDARLSLKVSATKGDTIDFAVGHGNDGNGRNNCSDSTALAATIKSGAGQTFDLSADFGMFQSWNIKPWCGGTYRPGPKPDATTFSIYTNNGNKGTFFGSVSNPGSLAWEDLLSEMHAYPRAPHTSHTMHNFRKMKGEGAPLFLSEYGVGSAVDYWRVTRQFEQLGKTEVEDARFYRDKLEKYLIDWNRWNLDELYARPEDFFSESLRKMAGQRTLGLNAIRANPNIIGYSLTGMNDHVSCGEGLTTTFRELKPGTVDAIFEGFAPLRLCLAVEPVNVYRGARVLLEAVLANEDALTPGEYPVRLQVVGPQNQRIFEKTVDVTIAKDAPFAVPIFTEHVVVDGPSGRYRFLASFEHGAAATGGETEFYVADPAEMPVVKTEVVLAGEDAVLAKWLTDHGIRTRLFAAGEPTAREVILIAKAPADFAELWRRVERGATAVFLSADTLKKGDQPLGWLPLANKGTFESIASLGIYLTDEWAKHAPIFDGLPSGGLMDYTYYREIIPFMALCGQDPPAKAVAGAIRASADYGSGLMVAEYRLGAGRFILNTLLIRDNLGPHPAAERLLRNMLRYAGGETSH